MTNPVATIRIDQGVGIFTINRPDKFNCLSLAVHRVLLEAIDRFEADPAVRCVLVRGEGKNFCTGADLEEVTGLRPSLAKLQEFLDLGHLTLRRLETSPLPVVVEVQGLALAGGLELMLAADVAFAGAGARLGDQHAHFGLVPGWGASQRLPRLIGRRRALDLMFSARWLSAADALAIGLVNYVVPDAELAAAAFDYCTKLAAKSRSGLALMKRLTDEGLDRTLAGGLDLERELAAPALQSDDVSEGLAAFGARRPPVFP